MFGSAVYFLLRAESFSCSLDVLYGGLGISKLQFLAIKTLDPDWIRIVFSVKCWIRFWHQ
jgi:hypothetical protein